jgi:hypothetical protein
MNSITTTYPFNGVGFMELADGTVMVATGSCAYNPKSGQWEPRCRFASWGEIALFKRQKLAYLQSDSDSEQDAFWKYHGHSYEAINDLPVSPGIKLYLRRAYQRDKETWDAAIKWANRSKT